MAYIESQLSLLLLLFFLVSNLTAFSPSSEQGEGLGLGPFLSLAAVALLMASVSSTTADDVVLAVAASLDVLAIVAAAAVAPIVSAVLIFKQFSNGEGETVQGIGGGARRYGEMRK